MASTGRTDRKSNDEFVRDLMRFGDPMKQLIIMEAIGRYAKDITENFDAETAESGIWNIINPVAWKRAAGEIHQAMETRNGS